ncbi:MAG: MFS transporter [Bacteroidetes bacterium]|nr:MFS transporter [Bacteroidota bacterium]
MGHHSSKELLKLFGTKRMLTVFLLGFSSGLPIMVVYSTLKLWLRRSEVDLSTIGYISWLALPYSYNFAWAFLFDRYTPFKKFGRRRSWLLITQIALTACFLLMSFGDPKESVLYIAMVGFALCFFSASHDVAVDAYRNEILTSDELGAGASFGVYGYRIAMLVASGFGIWVVDPETWGWSFNQMFFMLAGFMAVGIATTFWADEPKTLVKPPDNFMASVYQPFMEFFKRDSAILFLLFIFFFKFGDSLAGSMTRPYYADLGISNKDIGLIASTLGGISTLVGLFVGGSMMYRFGYKVTLWFAAITQMASTFFFVLLAFNITQFTFGGVVFFEDFSSGIGTAALVAFMGRLTSKEFTATQYALFASLASIARTMFAGFAGDIIEFFKVSPVVFAEHIHTGYVNFFFLCTLMAIPGMLFLYSLKKLDD